MKLSYSRSQGVENPAVPNNAMWRYFVRVKAFQESTPALLETAMNSWLLALDAVTINPVILEVTSLGISAGDFSVLVTYGYFTQV